MVTDEQFTKAEERAAELRTRVPKALSARYDRRLRKVVVQLDSNLGVFFSPHDAERLQHATAADLSEIEISPSGYGLHFPKIDADLYLPTLLEGIFGTQRWTADHAGRKLTRSGRSAAVGSATL